MNRHNAEREMMAAARGLSLVMLMALAFTGACVAMRCASVPW